MGHPALRELVQSWPSSRPVEISVLDPDIIEISNLNRQVFFAAEDLGRNKAELLVERIQQHFPRPEIQLRAHAQRLQPENLREFLGSASVVLDCSDHIPTKFLINDFCVESGIPFCYAGAVEQRGLCLAVPSRKGMSGCLRCLFGNDAEQILSGQTENCQTAGILGPVVGLIGVTQARLALGLLNVIPFSEEGSASILCRFTAETMEWSEYRIPAAEACALSCKTTIHSRIDLRGKQCPQTFLFTKLGLEELEKRENLEVFFGSLDALQNVRRSIEAEGHKSLFQSEPEESEKPSGWRLIIERGGEPI